MATIKNTTKTTNSTFFQRLKRFIWKAMLWFFGLSILSVIIFKWVPVPFTPLMITRAIDQKIDGKEMTCSHDWEPIDNISTNLQTTNSDTRQTLIKQTLCEQAVGHGHVGPQEFSTGDENDSGEDRHTGRHKTFIHI